MEAKFFETRYNLSKLGIFELAGYCGGNNSEYLVFLVILTAFNDVNGIKDKGLIHYCAERTLINACAAGDTLIVIYRSGMVIIHGNGLDLACVHAGAFVIDYSGVRAYLGAHAAINALGLIDYRCMSLGVYADSSALASIYAVMCKAASA